jgi:hypothetical protein
MNPQDFIEQEVELNPSDWIMRKAQEVSGMWLDQSNEQRTQSMIAAIIAWVEMDWEARKMVK